jgi:hypothetical protein
MRGRDSQTLAGAARVLAVVACLAALAAGCGGDEGEPIPEAQAAEINKHLNSIEDRFQAGGGACGDIEEENFPAIDQAMEQIPDGVDADVRDALEGSVNRLEELVTTECDETPRQQTTPQPAPPPVTVPPPQTETQETVPPPQTETLEQTVPEDDDNSGPGRGGRGQGDRGNRGPNGGE